MTWCRYKVYYEDMLILSCNAKLIADVNIHSVDTTVFLITFSPNHELVNKFHVSAASNSVNLVS